MSKCETCSRNVNGSVPIAVHENMRAQANVDKRRMFIIIIVLILALVGSNLAWVIYENQFEDETTTVEMENDSGYVSYIGNDGRIYNGEIESDEENANP